MIRSNFILCFSSYKRGVMNVGHCEGDPFNVPLNSLEMANSMTRDWVFKHWGWACNPLEFMSLNFNQVLTTRQTTFKFLKSNRTKVGLNSLSNRFHSIITSYPYSGCVCRLRHLNWNARDCSCDYYIIFIIMMAVYGLIKTLCLSTKTSKPTNSFYFKNGDRLISQIIRSQYI